MRRIYLIFGYTIFFISGFLGSWAINIKNNIREDNLGRIVGFNNKLSSDIYPNKSTTIAPTPTLTPTIIPLLTPTETAKPTLTPTVVLSPVPKYSSYEVNSFIDRFAGQYAVDPNVLRHIAVCESGFNPTSLNKDYAGLFQFSTVTWKNNRLLMGEDTNPYLRFNAEEAVQTAAYLLSIGKTYIWPNCMP